MVSDSEVVSQLREFLRTSDLNTTTAAIVRRKLEEDLGIDLSDKKVFIREQIDLYVNSELEPAEENEEDGEANEGKSEDDVEGDASSGKGAAKRGSNKKNKEVKKRGGGFSKLCSLSPQLQKFTGVPELARTEVVKQLWSYIREKNLQDPSNRRNIICDDTLHPLFKVQSINMFQMNKALAKHIWPIDSDDAPAKSTQKEKKRKRVREDRDEPKGKEKQKKGGTSGFLAPIPLSDALVKFLGTGENELSRADVIKRMWEYIKQNDLQDPSDRRRIISDEKLKELFDVDSFHGFTVSKLLTTHFIKTEQ